MPARISCPAMLVSVDILRVVLPFGQGPTGATLPSVNPCWGLGQSPNKPYAAAFSKRETRRPSWAAAAVPCVNIGVIDSLKRRSRKYGSTATGCRKSAGCRGLRPLKALTKCGVQGTQTRNLNRRTGHWSCPMLVRTLGLIGAQGAAAPCACQTSRLRVVLPFGQGPTGATFPSGVSCGSLTAFGSCAHSAEGRASRIFNSGRAIPAKGRNSVTASRGHAALALPSVNPETLRRSVFQCRDTAAFAASHHPYTGESPFDGLKKSNEGGRFPARPPSLFMLSPLVRARSFRPSPIPVGSRRRGCTSTRRR